MGMYCPVDDTGDYLTPEDWEPRNCTAGHYCGFGSFAPTACPKGTYQPFERMGHLIDCQPCKGGYHCKDTGIGNLVAFEDVYGCPEGKYCPSGIDITPVPCIAGSYISDEIDATQSLSFEQVFLGSSNKPQDIEDCNFCPKGYSCDKGTGDPFDNPCPPGYICPAGTGKYPKICPPGWFCEGTGGIESEECPEGFYCPAGTSVPFPCDASSVCPKKSASPATRGMTPRDCEPGTYLNVDRCAPCEEGHVCEKETS